MKKQCLVLMAVVMCVLSACQKSNSDNPKSVNEINISLSTQSAEGPDNPLNPYDSVGRLHNAGLDYIAKMVARTGDTSSVAAHTYLAKFCENTLHMSQLKISPAPYVLIRSTSDDDLYRLASRLPFSQSVKNDLYKLFKIITNGAEIKDYDTYKQSIVDFENKVLNDHSLTKAEQRTVLYATSVARFSAAYWSQGAGQIGTAQRSLCWLCGLFNVCIVLHDVTGMLITGGVAGGIGFSEFAADFFDAVLEQP